VNKGSRFWFVPQEAFSDGQGGVTAREIVATLAGSNATLSAQESQGLSTSEDSSVRPDNAAASACKARRKASRRARRAASSAC
jgi:hypothetical protein